jgi:hypothetical protein
LYSLQFSVAINTSLSLLFIDLWRIKGYRLFILHHE